MIRKARIENLALRVLAATAAGGVSGALVLFLVTVWMQPRTQALVVAMIGGCLVVASLTTVGALYFLGAESFPQDRHTYCGHCGYILKGITEPRCPECGERI
jgi:hypothetical protein